MPAGKFQLPGIFYVIEQMGKVESLPVSTVSCGGMEGIHRR